MFDNSTVGFLTYNEFFKRRERIKTCFRKMKSEYQDIYKMYLYAKRELSTTVVNLIWEYLNEQDNSSLCPTTEQLEQYFVEALENKPTNKEYLEEEMRNEH